MRAAGVHVLSMFAVACELMRDWRSTPGAKEMMPFFDTCVFFFVGRQARQGAEPHAHGMIGTFRSMGSWRGRTMRRLPTGRLRVCSCGPVHVLTITSCCELVMDRLGFSCVVSRRAK